MREAMFEIGLILIAIPIILKWKLNQQEPRAWRLALILIPIGLGVFVAGFFV